MRTKRFYHLLLSALMTSLLLVACGPSAPDPEIETEEAPPTAAPTETEEAEEDTGARPTITPDPAMGEEGESGYPAQPEATAVPQEGYPAAPTPIPTIDPYPNVAGMVWVYRAAGEQCAEADPLEMREAIATLTDAGIDVQEQTSMELAVCQACGCPTSLHFRAQIAAEDVAQATELGWAVEEE